MISSTAAHVSACFISDSQHAECNSGAHSTKEILIAYQSHQICLFYFVGQNMFAYIISPITKYESHM